MNSQTHILLACAVLVPVVAYSAKTKSPSAKALAVAAFIGAVLPDASIFIMWGIAKVQSVPESVIWQEWYYSQFWQQLGAMTNSLPLFLAGATLAWLTGGRWRQPLNNNAYWPTMLLTAASAAILHALSDLPLHHDDGHPHFWPFSDWIYSSPVSYWDPAHHGQIWSFIEILLAISLIAILWRRFHHRLTRSLLLLAGLSYLLMMGYWFLAVG